MDLHALASRANATLLFRFGVLALLLGQMAVYYDTSPKTILAINTYLLVNLLLIVAVLIPWTPATVLVWLAAWPLGLLLRLDWAYRPTNSDVYWATSQGVDFLLHGLNPYTQVYTWVYQHQPGISNYPAYSYFPGGLFAEAPFYLLGNVRLGLALADIATALLIYLLARPRLGEWPARLLAVFWLLFLPAVQVPLLLGVLDFFLLFWVALAVWLYTRGHPVGSALAAAMVFSTKQYGFLFAIPWAILLIRPLIDTFLIRRRQGRRGHSLLPDDRRLWLPPVAFAMLAGLIVLPLALLSPRAFYDATVVFHAKQLAVPALGTPQWNESLAGQLAGVGLVQPDVASPVASILLVALLLGLFVAAALKVRDAASALLWAALISGVSFAFNSGRVHFFYWRLTLLLFLLGFVMSFLPHEDAGAADINHAEADAEPALAGAPGGR